MFSMFTNVLHICKLHKCKFTDVHSKTKQEKSLKKQNSISLGLPFRGQGQSNR